MVTDLGHISWYVHCAELSVADNPKLQEDKNKRLFEFNHLTKSSRSTKFICHTDKGVIYGDISDQYQNPSSPD